MTSVNLEKTLEYFKIQESFRPESLIKYYLCKKKYFCMEFKVNTFKGIFFRRTIGHLRQSGNRALRTLGQVGTWALRALRHFGTWALRALRPLDTRAV